MVFWGGKGDVGNWYNKDVGKNGFQVLPLASDGG